MRASWWVWGIGAVVVGAIVFLLTRPSWSEDWHEVMALADGGAIVRTVRADKGEARSKREVETELTRIGSDGESLWTLARSDESVSRGQLASLDPDGGVLVWLEGSETVPLGWTMTGLSLDGAVLWRQEVEDPAFEALVVGDELWTRSAAALEVREVRTGALLHTHQANHASVFAEGVAFAARRVIVGSTTLESRSMDNLSEWTFCVVGDRQLGPARPTGERAKGHQLVWLDLQGQETVKTLVGLDERLANAWSLDVSSALCGRRRGAELAVIGPLAKPRWLVAIDPASGRVGWSLELPGEPLEPSSPWIGRGDAEASLPRFVALAVERAYEEGEAEKVARPGVSAYELVVVDLDERRISWSLALPASKEKPRVLRSNCCELVVWPSGERLAVVDSESGELVKVVDWVGEGRIEEQRQIMGDLLWFQGPSVGVVRIPDLVVVGGKTPGLPDVTTGVRRLVKPR